MKDLEKNKVYVIEIITYPEKGIPNSISLSSIYSLTLKSAQKYLTDLGYICTQKLNVEENDAELYVKPESIFFVASKARILEKSAL